MGIAGRRVLLVSGAASGIGAAAVRLFLERGWEVVGLDRDEKGLAGLAAQAGPDRSRLEIITGEVTDAGAVRQSVERAEARFGGLDALFTAAGILAARSLEESSEPEWSRILAVNVTGTFLCCKHAIPALRRRGGGAIITMGSIYAQASTRSMAAYTASKGAILSLTRQLALDVAQDRIRVNCVMAGAIDTPLLRTDPEIQEDAARGLAQWAAKSPLNRVGTPRDVATLVYFLASEDASFITGAAIPIDGGALAQAF